MTIIKRSWIVLMVFLLSLTGGVFANEYYSGYLAQDTYKKLAEVTLPSGQITHRWVSPTIVRKSYHAVMVDEVVFYPKAEPSEQVSAKTLQKIKTALTKKLRQRLATRIDVVDKPGVGVLQIQLAVTGVVLATEGMKAYEVVPIAALFGGVKALTGTRDKEVAVHVEANIFDSETGQLIAAVVRNLSGKDTVGSDQKLTLDDFKASIDAITKDGAQSVDHILQDAK